VDKREILLVLETIGAENIQIGQKNVQCACFLAPWRSGHRSDEERSRRASMGVQIAPNGESKIHCFACKYGGTLKRSIEDYSRLSGEDFSELIQKVGDYEEIDPSILTEMIPEYDEHEKRPPEIVLGENILDGIRGFGHTYLLDRGFDLETLKQWECGYDSKTKRVVFPIRDNQKRLVGAVGRTVVNHKIKYFNYFGFDKSRYLFGEHLVTEGTALVVVEGLLDTIKVWQKLKAERALDRYSVVGILGSDASKAQCQKLLLYSNEAILFLDNDPAGLQGQNKLALIMQEQVLLKSVDYPDSVGHDPDDVVEHGCSLSELFNTSKLIVAKCDIAWR